MHIVVCAKWITDPEVTGIRFLIDPITLRRKEVDGLAMVISPYDEQCFEAALRIREQLDGIEAVKITALCLGPESHVKLFKRAFSWDVEAGILLNVPMFDGGDGYATARALSSAIRKLGDVDLVLVGRQAADGDEGVVGYGIAEFLENPILPCASEIKVHEGSVTIERVLDDGSETLQTPLPAVVTVSNELGEARRPTMRQVMRAGRQKPDIWGAQDIGLDREQVEGNSARLIIEDMYIPKVDYQCEYIDAKSPTEAARLLVQQLRERRVIA